MVIHEEVAKKAYELWEQGGRTSGRDLENWIEAERIVRAKSKEGNVSGQNDSYKNVSERSNGGKKKSRKTCD